MKDAFRHTDDLSVLLNQSNYSAASRSTPEIRRRTGTGPAPLSFAQQRIWFFDQIEPGSTAYSLPAAFRLTGSLDVAALTESLASIVARHEILRTTFVVLDDQPMQVIGPAETVKLLQIDLAELSPKEREIEAFRIIHTEVQQPFDLANEPPLRMYLLRLSTEEHILLLNMHQIVADNWSVGVLLQELAALYRAFVTGEAHQFQPPPIQYADYAVWQHNWVHSADFARQMTYWKNQLADVPVLDLPTDRPRPMLQRLNCASYSFTLPDHLVHALRALSQREGATLFMTLLAAFQTLLYRYTGQSDLAVGSAVTGRTHFQTEALIGRLANTLVLRTNLSPNSPFHDVLTFVRKVCLDAYAHRDVPFEKIVDVIQERDPSRHPLFQVMFTLESLPSSLQLLHVVAEPMVIEQAALDVDLNLSMSEAAAGLEGVVAYNTDLFESGTIERMVGHFHVLLEAIATDPSQVVVDLPLLTDAECQQILVDWNTTQQQYPHDQFIHSLFEMQVARTPHAIAATYQDEALTYAELNLRANQLAHHLRKLGVGPEVRVGLYIVRSLDLVIGLLGILKAGAAYVPLDPSYPQERLAFMLQDSEVPVLITQQHVDPNIYEYQMHVICIDRDWHRISQESTMNPVSSVTSLNLAYVLYTSGSTGTPKGILISHQALANHTMSVAQAYDLQPSDRVLQLASLSFDVAAEELFPSWSRGATVVLGPSEIRNDITNLFSFIAVARLTVLNLTTTLWHEWLAALSSASASMPDSVRLVIVGCETMPTNRLAAWQKVVGDRVRWLNAYGATEATITTTFYEPRLDMPIRERASVPIGRPISNTQVYILDRQMQPVPVNVPGELYLGGWGLARGYLHRPELTADKFVPHPFTMEPGARLYQTGDLVRWLSDGNIQFVGRVDYQVKIRGFRIELDEIEAVLHQHPAVLDAVVVVWADHLDDKRIVAYVILEGPEVLTMTHLRNFLNEKLPEYMIPSALMILDTLPLTPSGKIDRRALPAPDAVRPYLAQEYVPPRTPVEEILVHIWEEVLHIERAGIHDNFFDLGGHSLLVLRVSWHIRNIFQLSVSMTQLFVNPTVAELAVALVEDSQYGPQIERIAQLLAQAGDIKSQIRLLTELREANVEQLSDQASQQQLENEDTVPVLLGLPERLVNIADMIAARSHRTIEAVFAQLIEHYIDHLPIEDLPDDVVLVLADIQMDPKQDEELHALLEINQEGELSDVERKRLDEIMHIYQRDSLRKAQALRVAVERGLRQPLS